MEKRSPRHELDTLEALLFASGEPISLRDISKVLALPEKACEKLVLQLKRQLDQENAARQIERFENRFQMTTRPLYYDPISVLYQSKQMIKLTETQLETLAIIVYSQPVTRQSVSDIRGVASDNVISRLIQMGLVEEAGRMKAPGRPILLKTTDSFLRVFGLSSYKELPGLPAADAQADPLKEAQAEPESDEQMGLPDDSQTDEMEKAGQDQEQPVPEE
ncbi:MAG: SMC-Scp complex subunit ScpB [Firmicutes bacterium]|nr:SMC-Scp complex subunit ScpB [Bacillota bacterium]